MANTTLKQVAKKVSDIADCIAKERNKIEIAALNQGHELMSRRIFEAGTALDGSSMGGYSDAYLAYRLKRGRNNAKKILFLEGNLRNNIQVGTYGGKNVLGHVDTNMADIAGWQEDNANQVGKPVFGFTEEEMEATLEIVTEGIINTITECFKRP